MLQGMAAMKASAACDRASGGCGFARRTGERMPRLLLMFQCMGRAQEAGGAVMEGRYP